MVVVTDLDGTLLDHDSYAWAEAKPALMSLRARGIPVVPCSSKTRAEMRVIARALDLDGPFIPENGGAVVWPRRTDATPPPGARQDDSEWVSPMGVPVERLCPAFDDIRSSLGLDLVSVASLDASEIAQRTGLTIEAAERARAREWSVPFFCPRTLTVLEDAALREAAIDRGLAVTTGGRFFHLVGPGGKRQAVQHLRRRLEDASGRTLTLVVLGDAPNDADMLSVADIAIVVPGANLEMTRQTAALVDGCRVAPAPGPRGWNLAMQALLRDLDEGTATR
jgi:mannosyl-3-phosphoglycerate phosphatase